MRVILYSAAAVNRSELADKGNNMAGQKTCSTKRFNHTNPESLLIFATNTPCLCFRRFDFWLKLRTKASVQCFRGPWYIQRLAPIYFCSFIRLTTTNWSFVVIKSVSKEMKLTFSHSRMPRDVDSMRNGLVNRKMPAIGFLEVGATQQKRRQVDL